MPNLFNELKRRNVIRVAAAYVVVGWLLLQVADIMTPALHLPEWIVSAIALMLMLGIFPALAFSWAYELTPDGLKKESEVDRAASDTSQTAKKLDVITIIAVAGVVSLIIWQQINPQSSVTVDAIIAESGQAQELTTSTKATAAIPDASIAVLPFADLSPDSDQGYFSDGVSEEILNVLAGIDGLRVASRTSAFAYKNSQQRIPEIAGELGVRHILEGSVRRAGETIRVTAQLIDAKTDEHLLSKNFDRTLTAENIFAIQGEIAQLIASALSDRIEIASLAAPVDVTADTDDIATLDLYYEANALFQMRGRENLARAMQVFEEVTRRDPTFARGWAGLSAVYSVGKSWGLMPRDYDRLGRDAANQAISLNPKLSTPWAVLAQIERDQTKSDWFAVLENFDRALQLNPDDINLYNWRALFWESVGYTDRAFADYESCLTLDPSYLNCGYNKHNLLIVTGRMEEADALYRSLLLKGAIIQAYNPAQVHLLAYARDDDKLLLSLNLLVADSYPGQAWMVNELYQAFTDPDFDHAERLKSFEVRRDNFIAQTGTDRSNAVDRTNILLAFRDFDRALRHPDGITITFFSFYRHISKEQKRQAIVDRELLEFWRKEGFPPQCRPVGVDDFECDFGTN